MKIKIALIVIFGIISSGCTSINHLQVSDSVGDIATEKCIDRSGLYAYVKMKAEANIICNDIVKKCRKNQGEIVFNFRTGNYSCLSTEFILPDNIDYHNFP